MNKKWIRLILIAAFVVLLVFGLRQAYAQEARIGLGQGVIGTSGKLQDVTLIYRDWYVEVSRFGGEDDLPDKFWRTSAGFRVDWRDEREIAPYLRFGVAYFSERPTGHISDHWAYDMAAGVRLFRVMELEWQHNSTAGRTPVNSGIDVFYLGAVKEF